MVSSFAILCNLCLLAPAVLALPSSPHGVHLARHRENDQSQLKSRDIVTSDNWAGAGWSEAAGTFTSVQAAFNVPTVVSGSSGNSASILVGIDGRSCTAAILEAGIYVSIGSDGQATYSAVFEWYPAPSSSFTQPITISPGDHIIASVYLSSPTSGVTIVENWTSGVIVSQPVNGAALCQQDAELVVEHGQNTPFPFFGTVNFANVAVTNGGSGTYTTSNANFYEIMVNGALTPVTLNPDGSVSVSQI